MIISGSFHVAVDCFVSSFFYGWVTFFTHSSLSGHLGNISTLYIMFQQARNCIFSHFLNMYIFLSALSHTENQKGCGCEKKKMHVYNTSRIFVIIESNLSYSSIQQQTLIFLSAIIFLYFFNVAFWDVLALVCNTFMR